MVWGMADEALLEVSMRVHKKQWFKMAWFDMVWGRADEALLEVDVDDEERFMWHTFLDRGDFSNAFRHCRNQVCSISHAPCMFA